jgi:hypothetical protein
MPFTIKKTEGYDQLLSGGRVVIKDNVWVEPFVQLTKVTSDTTLVKVQIDQVHRSRYSYWKMFDSFTNRNWGVFIRSNDLGTSRNHKWITEQRQLFLVKRVTKSVEWKSF